MHGVQLTSRDRDENFRHRSPWEGARRGDGARGNWVVHYPRRPSPHLEERAIGQRIVVPRSSRDWNSSTPMRRAMSACPLISEKSQMPIRGEDVELLEEVWRVAGASGAHCSALMGRTLELSLAHFRVLRLLAETPATLGASAVARELGCSKPNASQLVARLEQIECLRKERDGRDTRLMLLRLTQTRLRRLHEGSRAARRGRASRLRAVERGRDGAAPRATREDHLPDEAPSLTIV